MNGCMLFDEKTLSPTYQLQIGVPGNSYALEVAQKIGLPFLGTKGTTVRVPHSAQGTSVVWALSPETRCTLETRRQLWHRLGGFERPQELKNSCSSVEKTKRLKHERQLTVISLGIFANLSLNPAKAYSHCHTGSDYQKP